MSTNISRFLARVRASAGKVIFLGVIVFFAAVVTLRALAGPQTVATHREEIKAERAVVSKLGADERVKLPEGQLVAGNGLVEPRDRETRVSSNVPGRIQSILVKEGDAVEKGAPLLELDNGPERAAFDAAEADWSVSRAELTRTLRGLRKEDVDAIVADTDSTKARSSISQSSLERVELLAKNGAATPDELDKARRQAEGDKAALTAAEARRKAAVSGSRAEDVMVAQAKVQGAAARRDQAKATLERLTVRAPIAGRVLQVKTRVGEYFNPSAADALVVMGDTSKLRVRMDVDERDIAKVAVGAEAFATQNAFPDRRFAGKVVEVGKRMGRKNIRTDDPVERIDTKILEVVFELDDSTGLVPGLRVTSYVRVPKG